MALAHNSTLTKLNLAYAALALSELSVETATGAIVALGGIDHLVALVRDGGNHLKLKEQYATGTLANIARSRQHDPAIVTSGAIEMLVAIAQSGKTDYSKRNAARALANLAESRRAYGPGPSVAAIVAANCIEALVGILRINSQSKVAARAMHHSARALMNLAFFNDFRAAIVAAGAIAPLMELTRDASAEVSAPAKSALNRLAAGSADAKRAIAVGDVEAELRTLADKARHFQQKFDDALTASAEAREKQASVESRIVARNLELEQENAELKRELATTKKDLDDASAAYERLRSRACSLIAAAKRERDTLKRKLEKPEDEVVDLTDDTAQPTAAKQMTLRDLRDVITDGNLKKVKSEKADLESEKADLESKLKNCLQCTVCQDAKSSVILMPCMHVCLCEGCAETVRSHDGKCPMCRANFASVSKIYIA